MSRIVRRSTTAPRFATRVPAPVARGGRGGAVGAIAREMRAEISAMLAEVMTAAANAVAEATPIDTGHAQSNWILSTGRPFTGVDGSREAVSEAAQVYGLEKIAKYDAGRDGRIFLTNNVKYMPDLADGSSPQQPEPGWITKALLTASAVAPKGRRGNIRKALRAMGKAALRQGR
jgi:hypothetical protein